MEKCFGNKYKKYIIIPVILTIIMIILSFVTPGFSAGIDLTGGNLIIIRSDNVLSEQEITNILNDDLILQNLKFQLSLHQRVMGLGLNIVKIQLLHKQKILLTMQ